MSAPQDGGQPEPTLEQRVARLESSAQISELPQRYAQAYAALDVDGIADLYDETAEASPGRTGRDAWRDRFAAGASTEDGVRLALLFVGSHVVELDEDDPDRGTGRVLCHGEVERGGGAWFHQAIHYGDRYVRRDGEWRFARHRHHELFYGTEPGTRPNDLEPADWPERDVGRGTVPHRWPTWERFHADN